MRSLVSAPGIRRPLAVLTVVVLAALFGPTVWPIGPQTMDFGATLQGPSLTHPMGTDANGRDILARFLSGARLSLTAGALVALAGFIIGGGLGLISAFLGGFVDAVLMRAMDSLAAFPPIILAITVTVGLGPGLTTGAIGVLLSTLPFFARLMRSDTLRIRSMPFIEATSALGARPTYTAIRHVLPHTASTMLVQSAAVFGFAIMTIAGLGFIGLGAQIPTPEWGAMITDGMQYALTGQWWITVFPGIGLLVCVVAANGLADGLRDRLAPGSEQVAVRS
ncbi:MAG: ABC transporter permease [Hyphomicrobiales bacterium]|nr:ABC transporter permease [Hyphomicrobiales bacterium]